MLSCYVKCPITTKKRTEGKNNNWRKLGNLVTNKEILEQLKEKKDLERDACRNSY